MFWEIAQTMYNLILGMKCQHFWIDQSLFFHLHMPFNIGYATGLDLSAVT
jgi:hypothetical protein